MTLRALRKLLKSQKHFFAVDINHWCFDVEKRFSIEEVVVYSILRVIEERPFGKKESFKIKLAKKQGTIEYDITDEESCLNAPALVYTPSQAMVALQELKTHYMAEECKRDYAPQSHYKDRAYYSTLQLNK